MPYIKRLASLINGADTCGGGMKKQGLVYGPDHRRVASGIIQSKTALPNDFKFTLPGQAKKDCCSSVTK